MLTANCNSCLFNAFLLYDIKQIYSSIPFYSIVYYSILFYRILFYSIVSYSILSYTILLIYSTLLFCFAFQFEFPHLLYSILPYPPPLPSTHFFLDFLPSFIDVLLSFLPLLLPSFLSFLLPFFVVSSLSGLPFFLP